MRMHCRRTPKFTWKRLWVLGMYEYQPVAAQLAPLREVLGGIQADIVDTERQLNTILQKESAYTVAECCPCREADPLTDPTL